MQFSAVVNRFIVKTKLNSTFTNDLKRKEFFSKNVYSCRLSLFKIHTAFPTSIFVIFMIYFFSLHTISSFLKSSLLYCYHFMFEILNAMYVVQYIYVLEDELNKLLLSF